MSGPAPRGDAAMRASMAKSWRAGGSGNTTRQSIRHIDGGKRAVSWLRLLFGVACCATRRVMINARQRHLVFVLSARSMHARLAQLGIAAARSAACIGRSIMRT